jgi:hypothetical protein
VRGDRHDEIRELLARKRGQAMGGIEGSRPSTTSKEIGLHAECGGVIVYTSDGRTFGLRRCAKCGADGRYGRLSPDTVEEVARREALGGGS